MDSQQLHFKFPSDKTPMRLDHYLRECYPPSSRSYWNREITRLVRVNRKSVRKGQMLFPGDEVELLEAPQFQVEVQPNPELQLEILYQDEELLAVHKPAGLACYPLRSSEKDSVVNGLVARFPEQADLARHHPEAGLIHRLDTVTSGLLLFARSQKIKEQLMEMQRQGEILKTYYAWVEGELKGSGTLTFPIAHHPKNKAKMYIPRDEKEVHKLKARPAETHYEVLEYAESFTLLKLKISKGQRHQIRIHLMQLGHPIVGDSLYGAAARREKFIKATTHLANQDHPQPGQASTVSRSKMKYAKSEVILLHASQVEFHHPLKKKKIMIQSPLEGYFPISADSALSQVVYHPIRHT